MLCLQQCIGLLTSLIHCKRGVFATAGTKDKRAVTVQSVTAFKVFACSLTDLSLACVRHSHVLNRSADSMQCASAILVLTSKTLPLSMHVSGDTPSKLFMCWSLQPLHLSVFGTVYQCLWDCTSVSLGLHLNVFGTAPQCLWDCITMFLGTAGVC